MFCPLVYDILCLLVVAICLLGCSGICAQPNECRWVSCLFHSDSHYI